MHICGCDECCTDAQSTFTRTNCFASVPSAHFFGARPRAQTNIDIVTLTSVVWFRLASAGTSSPGEKLQINAWQTDERTVVFLTNVLERKALAISQAAVHVPDTTIGKAATNTPGQIVKAELNFRT